MEELNENFENKEESNFDLKAELYKYLTHWKWLVFGFLVGGLLAYIYNRYTTPEYRTQSSMMVVKDENKGVMNAMPSGGGTLLSLDNDNLQNQIETLRSKQLVEKVVDELNQNISYYIEGNVITVQSYGNSPVVINFSSPDSVVNSTSMNLVVIPEGKEKFLLKEESSGYSKKHSLGDDIKMNGLDFKIEARGGSANPFKNRNTIHITLSTLNAVAKNYIAKLEVGQKGKAMDILSLAVVQESPDRSEDFLNKLMLEFNKDGVSDKRQVAQNTAAFIQDRLEIITNELDSVEGDIAGFKRENKVMDVVSGAQEFRARSSQAEQKMFELQTQLSLIKSIKDYLQKQGKYELLPTNIGINSGGISGAITNYNTLLLERNKLLRTATPENPVLEGITAQVDSLRNNLKSNISGALNSINVELDQLGQREQVAEGKFSSFPGLEKGIRGIERQQTIKEQLYLFLLQRREEAAISFAATSDVAKVIDPAFTIASPVDPKPWIILLGGFLVGLIIPILIIFVKNFLDTKIHHKGDLQPLLKHLPFLGEIPKVSGSENTVIEINDRSPLAESFRILRTNMAYLAQNKNKERGEVIFVTSTIKGEGKTFVSYNLARTLGSTSKKTLLIGADIRNPKLHRYVEGPVYKEKGLSDYLYDYSVTEDEIITKSSQEGIKIDLLLSGAIPPNPAELFMSERMEKLLKNVAKEYDYVIVDTAPTMIVTDTLLISPLADTTLYVTRADYTEKKLLDFPKDLKKQGKLKGLAIVLNDVDYSKFSYGAKYGYSYGYGYGYGQDRKNEGILGKIKKPFQKK